MMLKKAGYLQRNGMSALDEQGIPREIIELQIYGARLGIRIQDLVDRLGRGMSAKVERIQQNWKECLCGTAGLAECSKSGKAMNIELANGERFTISLESLYAVLRKEARYAYILEIPHMASGSRFKNHNISEYTGSYHQRYPGSKCQATTAA